VPIVDRDGVSLSGDGDPVDARRDIEF